MKKDFASKPKKRGNATRFDENKPDNSMLITMVLGLVLGIGITLAAVYYYNQPPQETAQVTEAEKPPEKPSAKNIFKEVPAEEVEEPRLTFHEDLKNKIIEVDPAPLPEQEATSDETFIMQCGSFRRSSSAEKRRAEIALNGFEPRINSTVNEQGNTWYRVQLGPYKSKRRATTHRNQLRRNGIDGCVIW